MQGERFDYYWSRRHEILWRISLSTLYHRRRERFFDTWDRVVKAVSIIGGSAALAKLGAVPAFASLGGERALA